MLVRKTKILFLVLISAILTIMASCANTNENNSESESYAETENIMDNTESLEEDTSEKHTENFDDTMTENDTEQNTETSDPTYTFEDFIQSMYTTDTVNVRNLPCIDGEKIGGLLAKEEVQITGRCKETGWYRINYDGGVGYVSADYITDKSPSSWVAELDVAEDVSQMIIVTADKMGIIDVTVSMHTKNENGVWVEEYTTPGQIGRNGLGKEREGDGKTPIGIFTFTKAFGILPNPGITSMSYLQVDETHHWVDDPESKYYNQCVSTRDVEPDWNSTEHLYKYVGDYNYALATSYNIDCTPYVGCAIFLHCPVKDFRPTSGCIAIPEEYMVQTLVQLRDDCIIIIDLEDNIYSY